MILAKSYIQTGFSAADAEKLDVIIKPLFVKREKIVIDFEEIKIFTTLFFNIVLGKYVMEIGPEEYEKLFELKNLTEIGDIAYLRSLENAKSYYKCLRSNRKSRAHSPISSTTNVLPPPAVSRTLNFP